MSLIKLMTILSKNNMNLFLLSMFREAANETYRHPWDAMSEALDILLTNNEQIFAKYLVVFVFGDVIPLVTRNPNERKRAKKTTAIWFQSSVHEIQKRQSVYETLIEKIE